jgi:hypothetical protein
LAFAYAQVGRSAEGVRAAERGIAIRAARGDDYDPYLHFGLGAALWAAGVDPVRGHALVVSAAREFRVEHYDAASRKRAEDWLAAHAPASTPAMSRSTPHSRSGRSCADSSCSRALSRW